MPGVLGPSDSVTLAPLARHEPTYRAAGPHSHAAHVTLLAGTNAAQPDPPLTSRRKAFGENPHGRDVSDLDLVVAASIQEQKPSCQTEHIMPRYLVEGGSRQH